MSDCLLMLFLLTFSYCSVDTKPYSTETSSEDVGVLLSDSLPKPGYNKPPLDNLDLGCYQKITGSSVVEVLTMQKIVDTSSRFFNRFANECNRWTLTKKDIRTIVNQSSEIDGLEYHHFFEKLPCSYSGQLLIDGKLALFQINAGSSSTLSYKDTSIYLGYKKVAFRSFFILGPGTD